MRSSSAQMIAARANPNLVSRDFIRIAGRNRSTGAIQWANFWSDIGVVNAPILDIDTGSAAYYDFTGSGTILSVGDLTFVCEQSITVATQTITLSQLNQTVIDQVRGYDLHEQPINIYQGDFDPITRVLVAPAESAFSGFIDTVMITDPSVEEAGQIELQCRSHVTEMTRTNTLTRSHASEILRSATDMFYSDTAVVGDWLMYWGQDIPKPAKSTTSQNSIEAAAKKIAGIG